MKYILLFIFSIWSPFTYSQNNPPVANQDSVSVNPGITKFIFPKQNDTDPDGNIIILNGIIYTSGKGTASLAGANVVKYTADSFYFGLDTILYIICDNGNPSLCDTGLIVVNVFYVGIAAFSNVDINNIIARINCDASQFWDLTGSASFEVP